MKQAHFYCFGFIENEQSAFASEFGIISMSLFANFIQANQDADEFIIHIHSQGGDVDEGFGIYDLLTNSGKKITTIIEGNCQSIATIIALAGSSRKMTENSNFLIHNPWGMAVGEASEIHEYADEVKAAEIKILDFYIAKTGAKAEQIQPMMDAETKFTPEQAKELGFITEILKPISARSFKKITTKNSEEMKKTIVDTIKALFKDNNIEFKPKAATTKGLDIVTDKGTLHIETTETEPKVGDKATIEGAPASEGEYVVTADESNITIDATGAISEIESAEEEQEEPEDMKNLKTENETLKAEILALKKTQEEADAEGEVVKANVEALAKQYQILAKSIIGSGFEIPKEVTVFNKLGTEKSDKKSEADEIAAKIREKNAKK